MAAISFGGLGNGLDFGQVVDQLVESIVNGSTLLYRFYDPCAFFVRCLIADFKN